MRSLGNPKKSKSTTLPDIYPDNSSDNVI